MYKLGPIHPTHLPFHPSPPDLPTVMMIETKIGRMITNMRNEEYEE